MAERLPGVHDRPILLNAGKVSKDAADTRAGAEYEKFASLRRAFLEAESESSAMQSLEEQARQFLREGQRRGGKKH